MSADHSTSKTSSNSKTPLGSAGSEIKSIGYSKRGLHFQDFQNGPLEVVAQVVDFASLPDFQNFHPYRGKPALEVAALPLGEALKTEIRVEIISRSDARSAGLLRYFTGRPCPRGHVTWRAVSSASCSACCRERAAERKARDPDHIRRLGRESYGRHADKNREEAKAWALKNPERVRKNKRRHGIKYRAEKRAEISATKKAWYERNRDRLLDEKRAKRLRNIDAARARNRAWARANPEKVNAWNQRRRAVQVAAVATLTADDVIAVRAAQRDRCAFCGAKTKLTVDHIVPLSRGGDHTKANIQMLCRSCNSRKWAHDPIDFARAEGRLL